MKNDGTSAVVVGIVTRKKEQKDKYISVILGDELVWINYSSYQTVSKEKLVISEVQFRNPGEVFEMIRAKKDGPIQITTKYVPNKYVSFVAGGRCNPR